MQVLAININYQNSYNTNFKAVNSAKNMQRMMVKEIIDTDIAIKTLSEKKNSLVHDLYSDKNYIDTFCKQKMAFINKPEFSEKSIDKVFPGYSRQKSQIKTFFINYINKENKVDPFDIPAAIILYGNNNVTKPFLDAIKTELDSRKITVKQAKITGDFVTEINNLTDIARKEYYETGKHTAVIFDKPEKYFSVGAEEASLLGIELDEIDKNILSTYTSDMHNISFFKSLLDEVSKLPAKGKNNGERSALTFIMTTENPHLIHPDLISRPGKVMFLDLGIPRGDNLKEIILDLVELPELLSDNILWKFMIKELNPNNNRGGLSINNIRQAIKESEDSLGYILNLISLPREIPPKTCERSSHINKNLGITETTNAEDAIDLLIRQKNMGLLSPKSAQLLDEQTEELKQKLAELNNIIKSDRYSQQHLYQREKIKEILEKI